MQLQGFFTLSLSISLSDLGVNLLGRPLLGRQQRSVKTYLNGPDQQTVKNFCFFRVARTYWLSVNQVHLIRLANTYTFISHGSSAGHSVQPAKWDSQIFEPVRGQSVSEKCLLTFSSPSACATCPCIQTGGRHSTSVLTVVNVCVTPCCYLCTSLVK